MKNLVKWAIVVSNAFLLIACSPPMPDMELDTNQQAENRQHFKWEERKPLRKVKLAGDFFISKELDANLPKDVADTKISVKFPGRIATLGDIVFLLEQKGFPVSYNWTVYEDVMSSGFGGSSSSDDSMDLEDDDISFSSTGDSDNTVQAINTLESKVIPFKVYKGTVKGLLRRLQSAMNISYWWEDGSIYLSTNQEYVVSVPQQKEIIDSIVSEIEALGATNVTSSLTAGQVVYYAKPRSQSNLIKPFLQRIAHNLSEITLQVALVQVEINGSESRGFDWEAFNLKFGTPGSLASSVSVNDSLTINPIDGAGDIGVGGSATGFMGSHFFRQGVSIFGTQTDVSVDMAINILSAMGKTTTEQNVEMRTISGKEVTLESVQEESYVSGYEGGSTGDNPEPASPEFDTVETGLVLTFLPVFDAYNAIVTIDATIDLSARLEDTTVTVLSDAGTTTDDGSSTSTTGSTQITIRPNIKKDSFEDIVRIPVGETVILGGLMNEKESDQRTAPLGAWKVNNAKQETTKQALFMIIRPLVTLYETAGNEAKYNEADILKKTKYNYDKASEKKKEDEVKAKKEKADKKAAELKKAKAKVNQKALELKNKKEQKDKQEAEMKEKMAKMKAKLEAEHKAEMEAKEKEAVQLKAEMEEHKRARAVLEAEGDWEDEAESEEVIEEAETEVKVEIVTEEVLSEDEMKKIQMLNMLRGIKG